MTTPTPTQAELETARNVWNEYFVRSVLYKPTIEMIAHIIAAHRAESPAQSPFGHDEHGHITHLGIAYLFSSLGETELGLQRAERFSAWLNERVTGQPADPAQAHAWELETIAQKVAAIDMKAGLSAKYLNTLQTEACALLATLERERKAQKGTA